MSNIKITESFFNYELHGSVRANGGAHRQPFVYHMFTAHNIITINDMELTAIYQAGGYDHNDYNCPSNDLTLHNDSSEVLIILYSLTKLELEQAILKDYVKEQLDEIQELIPALNTIDKIIQLHTVLHNHPQTVFDFLPRHSEELDNYIQDKDGLLILK